MMPIQIKPFQQTILDLFAEIRRLSGDDTFSLDSAPTLQAKIELALSKATTEPQAPYDKGMLQAEWNIATIFLAATEKNIFVRATYLAANAANLKRWAHYIEPEATPGSETLKIQDEKSKALALALIPFLQALPSADDFKVILTSERKNLETAVARLTTRIAEYDRLHAGPADALPETAPPRLNELQQVDAKIELKSRIHSASEARYSDAKQHFDRDILPHLEAKHERFGRIEEKLVQVISNLHQKPRVLPEAIQLSELLRWEAKEIQTTLAQARKEAAPTFPRGPLQLNINKIAKALELSQSSIATELSVLNQSKDAEQNALSLSGLQLRQDEIDYKIALVEKSKIELTTAQLALRSRQSDLQSFLTVITRSLDTDAALEGFQNKNADIQALTEQAKRQQASFERTLSALRTESQKLDAVLSEIRSLDHNATKVVIQEKAGIMKASIQQIAGDLTTAKVTIQELHKLVSDLSTKHQAIEQAHAMELRSPTGLLKTFFGQENTSKVGLFGTYLKERKDTYFWKDLFDSFAALVFGCFNYKSEQSEREHFIGTLKASLKSYADNPNHQSLEDLQTIIQSGQRFKPRSKETQKGHEKTLSFTLNLLNKDLIALQPTLDVVTHAEEDTALRSLRI